MKRFYCTYFDRNYLIRGLALIDSLHRNERHEFVLFAVCMDELSRTILEKLALKNVVPLPIHEIECGDAPLVSTKKTRSLVEYYWTSTPTIILYLIEHYPDIEVLTYVDADLFFFSTPDPIFQELGHQSILLHEHRFSPSTRHLAIHNGKYNVGLLCFRNDQHGIQALRWWRERCLEWCFAYYEDGKLGDQMYLNDWTTRFPQVVELQHIGGGLGPWNCDQYEIRKEQSGEIFVNELPVIFYHFHALRFVNPQVILPVEHLHYPISLSVLRFCYLPYILTLSKWLQMLRTILSNFECGLRSEAPITSAHVIFTNACFADGMNETGIPQIPIRMDSEWDCYCPAQVKGLQETPNGHIGGMPYQTYSKTIQTHGDQMEAKKNPGNGKMVIQNQYELFSTLQQNPFVPKIQALYIIGAHLFQEREMLLQMLPNLQHIYLFEPIPECVNILRQYEAQDSRLRVFPYAISQVDGMAEFFITNNQGESSSLLPMGTHREIFPDVHHVNTIIVQSRRLESVIQEFNLVKPDMLFLDVQGAEFQILSSLSEGLLSEILLIYAEASLEELYQGSKTLQDLRAVLAPHFAFEGYAPMSGHTPTHGNALFANRGKEIAGERTMSMITNEKEPLVSVIVSTYNSLEFIRECLEDLEGQTLIAQMEIIVVDAASQQHERTVVEEFQERFRNIVYIRTSTKISVYAAWNLAIRASRGKYITPFSTNDRLRKNAYAILVQALEDHQDIPLVYGDTYITQVPHETFERHTRFGEWKWPEYSFEELLQKCLVGPHPMWRRNLHETIGYFDEQFQALGDQEFWRRVGEHHQLLHIPEFTGLYWVSPEGLSNRKELADPELSRIQQKYATWHLKKLQEVVPEEFDCSIIIPVFNKVELTHQCVTQLAEVTEGNSYEVILVDNASTDGTFEFLASLSGDIQIITNKENLGFAKACNQGAAIARGRYLVFLNNDTIPKPGWLRNLWDEVEHHSDVGVVGSKLLYPDGRIQHAGVVISKNCHMPYHLFRGVPGSMPAVNTRQEFQAVTAACMLVRKEVFKQVGGFDEAFVNGFEDIDMCLKIRQMDMKVVYQPKSCLYHLESQTPGRQTNDMANGQRFYAKWKEQWLIDEDIVANQNGYFIEQFMSDEQLQSRMIPQNRSAHPAAWRRVVNLQELLFRQKRQLLAEMIDSQKIRHLLVDVEGWPSDLGILEWLGRVCETLHLEQEAVKYWAKLLLIGDHPNARLGLARGALKNGSLDEAQRHLDVLQRNFIPKAEGWALQGILAMQRESYSKAKHAFEQSLAIEGTNIKSLMGIGLACMGLGETAEGFSIFERVLSVEPDHVEAMRGLMQAGTAMQKWEALASFLAQFIERNPGDCDMRFALAGVEFRAGRMSVAKQQFEILTLLKPDYEGLKDLEILLETTPPYCHALAT